MKKLISYIFFTIGTIALIPCLFLTSENNVPNAEAVAYFPSPLKQIREGTPATSITCTEGLELVLKKSTGQPACLKPNSVAKLIARGWAVHILPDYTSENNNSEIFALGTHDVKVENVQYFDGINGYLAKPTDDGKYPAIVMMHEWWGLNENIKEMAQKLASHGFIVLAVDLYNGKVGTTSEEAIQLMSSFDQTSGTENMKSAVEYLKKEYSPSSIGSIGWCFGGGQSLNLALNSNLNATVIYYGQLATDPQEISKIKWPILGIFAGLDTGITPEKVHQFEAILNEQGIENEIYIYPGVNHAFANPSGDRYAPEETKDAWAKTIQFFDEKLK